MGFIKLIALVLLLSSSPTLLAGQALGVTPSKPLPRQY